MAFRWRTGRGASRRFRSAVSAARKLRVASSTISATPSTWLSWGATPPSGRPSRRAMEERTLAGGSVSPSMAEVATASAVAADNSVSWVAVAEFGFGMEAHNISGHTALMAAICCVSSLRPLILQQAPGASPVLPPPWSRGTFHAGTLHRRPPAAIARRPTGTAASRGVPRYTPRPHSPQSCGICVGACGDCVNKFAAALRRSRRACRVALTNAARSAASGWVGGHQHLAPKALLAAAPPPPAGPGTAYQGKRPAIAGGARPTRRSVAVAA